MHHAVQPRHTFETCDTIVILMLFSTSYVYRIRMKTEEPKASEILTVTSNLSFAAFRITCLDITVVDCLYNIPYGGIIRINYTGISYYS